jgi:hypothetical protein
VLFHCYQAGTLAAAAQLLTATIDNTVAHQLQGQVLTHSTCRALPARLHWQVLALYKRPVQLQCLPVQLAGSVAAGQLQLNGKAQLWRVVVCLASTLPEVGQLVLLLASI